MKHTPGPWIIEGAKIRGVLNGELTTLARIYELPCVGSNDDVGADRACGMEIANALLIAAAPEMLRCLQGVMLVVTQIHEPEMEGSAFNLRITGRELEATRAAIAKASGE